MLFRLYQQFTPTALPTQSYDGTEEEMQYAANLIPCGTIEAPDGEAALRLARELSRFKGRSRSTLLAFPIVEELIERAAPSTSDSQGGVPPKSEEQPSDTTA